MYKKVFLDANVILDCFDTDRPHHANSYKVYEYLIINSQIFTSCDIITTLYYVGKKVDKQNILHNIRNINKTVKVIEFSNKEVEETCQLMADDERFADLEDTLQFVMAKKYDCDLIISNDKNFASLEIPILSSEEFCELIG
ncbi:MAG: ribonuclease [Sulfurovum sp. AS07-7]|nr:MAG: ribonuclease [Sulfurovum sp. AS07-7]